MKSEKGLSEIALTIVMVPIMLAITASIIIQSSIVKNAKRATEKIKSEYAITKSTDLESTASERDELKEYVNALLEN